MNIDDQGKQEEEEPKEDRTFGPWMLAQRFPKARFPKNDYRGQGQKGIALGRKAIRGTIQDMLPLKTGLMRGKGRRRRGMSRVQKREDLPVGKRRKRRPRVKGGLRSKVRLVLLLSPFDSMIWCGPKRKKAQHRPQRLTWLWGLFPHGILLLRAQRDRKRALMEKLDLSPSPWVAESMQ